MGTVFKHPTDMLAAAGQHLGYSEWMTIDQQRINQFAEATGDYQWIHVDEARALQGPFGKTIAHGCLISALASKFLAEVVAVHSVVMAVNYGFDRIRYPAPVPAGSRIRGGCELIAAAAIKGAIQTVIRVTVDIEGGDRPACVVDTINRFFPA